MVLAKLKYHQKAFDLLGIAPLTSEVNRQTLEKAASASKQRLPAAVLEWLSLENGNLQLRRLGGGDPTLTLKELIDNLQAVASVKKQRLVFMRAKVGVCWAIDLTEEPDPPVLVRLQTDDGGDSWRTTADHFSDFVLNWIWDRPVGGMLAKAQIACTLKQIRKLASQAIELPGSRAWPRHKTFRFQFAQGRMAVHYQPDDWTELVLWSDSAESLAKMVRYATAAGIPANAFFSDQPTVHKVLMSTGTKKGGV